MIFDRINKELFKRHGFDGGDWAMTFAEKFAIAGILGQRRPKVAIEVGTLKGGSLSIISHYSEKVYSVDRDPGVKESLEKKFGNVDFITGYSREVLPGLIEKLNLFVPIGYAVDGYLLGFHCGQQQGNRESNQPGMVVHFLCLNCPWLNSERVQSQSYHSVCAVGSH